MNTLKKDGRRFVEHKESRETLDFIADWIDPNFFYSKKDVWHRMGMLGVFGDYVLSCTPGDVAEIGCGESSIYLSAVAKKYSRRSYHCDVAPGKIINPLSVPGYFCQQGSLVKTEDCIGQPPRKHETFPSLFFIGTSDDMFVHIDIQPLALSFIDGDHNYAQAKKDFENLLALTVDNGFVLMHDTFPDCEEFTSEHRCGDVYKLRQELERDPRVDVMTLTRGTAMGYGLTICRKRPANAPYYQGHIT